MTTLIVQAIMQLPRAVCFAVDRSDPGENTEESHKLSWKDVRPVCGESICIRVSRVEGGSDPPLDPPLDILQPVYCRDCLKLQTSSCQRSVQ